jgi:hypothetical protein
MFGEGLTIQRASLPRTRTGVPDRGLRSRVHSGERPEFAGVRRVGNAT